MQKTRNPKTPNPASNKTPRKNQKTRINPEGKKTCALESWKDVENETLQLRSEIKHEVKECIEAAKQEWEKKHTNNLLSPLSTPPNQPLHKRKINPKNRRTANLPNKCEKTTSYINSISIKTSSGTLIRITRRIARSFASISTNLL